jgi:regulator of RNase E activity RraB
MNDNRRKRLRDAARLAGEARQIIDDILTQEPDADAISFLESAADHLDLADSAIDDAIKVGR